jgi:hypothetical protein
MVADEHAKAKQEDEEMKDEQPVEEEVVYSDSDADVEMQEEEPVEEEPQDPEYEPVEYTEEHKLAESAIQKVMRVLTRPVTLKSHIDRYLSPLNPCAPQTHCENEYLQPDCQFFIFPLDSGMVCIQHTESGKNFQMTDGGKHYRIRNENKN